MTADKPILIQGAMAIEINWLLARLQVKKLYRLGVWSFWQGTVASRPVIINQTGMGFANVAAATVLALNRFAPALVINQGTAGAHDAKIKVGDLVLATKAVNTGAMVSASKNTGEGSSPFDWQSFGAVTAPPANAENDMALRAFDCDRNWLRHLRQLSSSYAHGEVHCGVIGSADMWNREADRIKHLHRQYHTLIEDMESAAVGQITSYFNTPFIGVRVVSNNELSGGAYRPEVAAYSQEFIRQALVNTVPECG